MYRVLNVVPVQGYEPGQDREERTPAPVYGDPPHLHTLCHFCDEPRLTSEGLYVHIVVIQCSYSGPTVLLQCSYSGPTVVI